MHSDLAGPLTELLSAGAGGVFAASHADMVEVARRVVMSHLAVDECLWLEPGALATHIVGTDPPTPWTTVLQRPRDAARVVPAGRVCDGLMAAAPVDVCGETGALVVWRAQARPWREDELAMLSQTARALGATLTSSAADQVSPTQRAWAEFNALRSELLTTLSHELRTPLTVIGLGLEMLYDTNAAPEGAGSASAELERKTLDRMARGLERLTDLAASIAVLGEGVDSLDSGLDDGDGSDVSAVVSDRAARWRQRWPEIEAVAAADEARVTMPPRALCSLLDRLLDNAVKFSPAGSPIVVRVISPTGPNRHVDVEVVNLGTGIAEHEQHRLGAAFYRASNARRSETQGPGLGLAAAIELAARWGGQVTVCSTPEVSTVARVRLPALGSALDHTSPLRPDPASVPDAADAGWHPF